MIMFVVGPSETRSELGTRSPTGDVLKIFTRENRPPTPKSTPGTRDVKSSTSSPSVRVLSRVDSAN